MKLLGILCFCLSLNQKPNYSESRIMSDSNIWDYNWKLLKTTFWFWFLEFFLFYIILNLVSNKWVKNNNFLSGFHRTAGRRGSWATSGPSPVLRGATSSWRKPSSSPTSSARKQPRRPPRPSCRRPRSKRNPVQFKPPILLRPFLLQQVKLLFVILYNNKLHYSYSSTL